MAYDNTELQPTRQSHMKQAETNTGSICAKGYVDVYGTSTFSTSVSEDAAGVVVGELGGREAGDGRFDEASISTVVRLLVRLLRVRRRMYRKLRHRLSCDLCPCSFVSSMREYCDLFMVTGGHSSSVSIPYCG